MYFNHKKASRYSFFILLLVQIASMPVYADWKLNTDKSSVQFISSKLVQKTHHAVFEQNRFEKFTGEINKKHAVLSIQTNSVNTRVPVRDERIHMYVFQSARYPEAKAVINVTTEMIEGMKTGELHKLKVDGTLTLVGKTHPISAQLSVVRTTANTLLVQTHEAILLDAKQYQLEESFLKLRDIVHLFSIPTTIPIHFYLVFEKK